MGRVNIIYSMNTAKKKKNTKTANYFRTHFHCLVHLLTHSPSHPSIHPPIHLLTHSPSHYHQKGAEQWTILFNNTIHWQIKHFTVIYGAGNNNFFFAAKKPPYLGPLSPYQKLQISLFHSKLISHVWPWPNSVFHWPKYCSFTTYLSSCSR